MTAAELDPDEGPECELVSCTRAADRSAVTLIRGITRASQPDSRRLWNARQERRF